MLCIYVSDLFDTLSVFTVSACNLLYVKNSLSVSPPAMQSYRLPSYR
jgi:hypothetical protein